MLPVPYRIASAILSLFWDAGRVLIKVLGPSWDGSGPKYMPERHYMRGPGPKWREKHGSDRAHGVGT